MTNALFEHWWPVTYDYGLIRAAPEETGAACAAWYRDDPSGRLSTETKPLAEHLAAFEPITIAKNRTLLFSLGDGWTAFLRNGIHGSDAASAMPVLAKTFGTIAMQVCVTPREKLYQGVTWAVYDGKTPVNGVRVPAQRSIAALNDGGRWVFEQSGAPFAFEDQTRYAAKRKRDRFTAEMLREYLAAFGAPDLLTCGLRPEEIVTATLHHRDPWPAAKLYSLEDWKAEEKRRSGRAR